METKWVQDGRQARSNQTLILSLQAKQHSSKVLSKKQGVGGSPIARTTLLLINIWNHPAHKN